MQFTRHEHSGVPVVVIETTADAQHDPIDNAGAALDLFASAQHAVGATRIVMPRALLAERFFDLASSLAGEILQKVSNYGLRLAIVGDFTRERSKALRDFIRESNEYGHVIFVERVDEAVEQLSVG